MFKGSKNMFSWTHAVLSFIIYNDTVVVIVGGNYTIILTILQINII